jgi:hypothetical protein
MTKVHAEVKIAHLRCLISRHQQLQSQEPGELLSSPSGKERLLILISKNFRLRLT